MGGTCGTYGGQKCIQGFGWKNPREREQLEDLGILWEDNIKIFLQ
jgi:hypothetical protein